MGRHLKTKDEAKAEADRIKTQIRDGVFVRAADRRKAAGSAPVTSDAITLAAFAEKYLKGGTPKKARNRVEWEKDMRWMVGRVTAFQFADGTCFGDKC